MTEWPRTVPEITKKVREVTQKKYSLQEVVASLLLYGVTDPRVISSIVDLVCDDKDEP